MENDQTLLQMLLVAIGVLLVLLSVFLYNFSIVRTGQRMRKGSLICGLVITVVGVSLPPLLHWLGYT